MSLWVFVLAYHMASRLAYVGWVGAALRAEERERRFTRDGGVEAGFARFRRRAAFIMNNDGAGFVALCFVSRETLHLPLPALVAFAAGALLITLSVAVKMWAVRTLGWDAYHWRNFFDAAVVTRPVTTGPYRFFRNPMYTVGNLHLYGLALATASLPGLGAAAFDHAAILLFYRLVERPHFLRSIGR